MGLYFGLPGVTVERVEVRDIMGRTELRQAPHEGTPDLGSLPTCTSLVELFHIHERTTQRIVK